LIKDQVPEGRTLREILSARTAQELDAAKGKVLEIGEDATVYDAIKRMSDKYVGSILVNKKGSKEIAGIFTERDYIRKIILKDLSSKTTMIRDVMTPNVITASPKQTIYEISRLMATNNFRHVPIVSDKGACSGIVSSRDIVGVVIDSAEAASDIDLNKKLHEAYDKLCRNSSKEPYVSESDTVYHALRIMAKQGIGAVFVSSGHDLTGIFTERDYLNKIILQGRFAKDTKVKKVMTRNVITANSTQSVLSCLQIMREHKFRNLPVVPLLGDAIDYSELGPYENIGMLTEMDVIKYVHKLMNPLKL